MDMVHILENFAVFISNRCFPPAARANYTGIFFVSNQPVKSLVNGCIPARPCLISEGNYPP